MRKTALLALLLLALAACGPAKRPLAGQTPAPPDLTVYAGQAACAATTLTYQWTETFEDGKSQITQACGIGPQEVFYRSAARAGADATLDFGIKPDTVTAVFWPDGAESGADLTVTDGALRLPDESGIVELRAWFPQGDSYYSFRSEALGGAPSPMTVRYVADDGRQALQAAGLSYSWTVPQPNGTGLTTCGDSPSPAAISYESATLIRGAETQIVWLTWPAAVTDITAEAWPADSAGGGQGPPQGIQALTPEGNSLPLPESGDWIIVVHARFSQGECSYSFWVTAG